jgi:DNA-binding NarL/FixJ family response regulator
VAEDRLLLLIAEDNALMRESLCLVLQQEFEIAAVVDNGPEVLQRIEELHPDILLLDISLPGMSGLKVARELRRIGNNTRIVFLTGYMEAAYVEEAARIGVEGYVLKRRAQSELIAAIRQVSEGKSYISPEVQQSASATSARSG